MSTTDSETHAYDLRQYRLMLDRLEAFKRGAVTLRKLIEDLRALVETLQVAQPSWKEDFIGNWWILEQVYAVAIDRDELDRLPFESQRLVDAAIVSLLTLVLEALRSLSEMRTV